MRFLCEGCSRPWYLRDKSSIDLCDQLCGHPSIRLFATFIIQSERLESQKIQDLSMKQLLNIWENWILENERFIYPGGKESGFKLINSLRDII